VPPEYTAQMMPAVLGLSACANATSKFSRCRAPARDTRRRREKSPRNAGLNYCEFSGRRIGHAADFFEG